MKYITTNSIDGQSYTDISPDIYPANTPDPGFRVPVFEANLAGGNETFLKQPLATTDRPTDYNASSGIGGFGGSGPAAALAWLRGHHRATWLKSYTIPAGADAGALGQGSPGNATLNDITVNIDETQLVILAVQTTLADNFTSPASDGPPPVPANTLVLPGGSVPAGGGPGTGAGGGNALDYLSQELLSGTVTDWMTSDQNVYQARVKIEITVQYTGNDALVQSWFGGASDNYTIKLAFPCLVTNGQTQTYEQLASATPSEQQPAGLAQYLYEGWSMLHYEGTIKLVEQECSGLVKLANTVNLTGGRPEWATMQAQVDEIEENLDTGETTIRLGPPKILSAAQLVDILRTAFMRQQTQNAQARQTGQASSSSPTISGAGATSAIGINLPPSMSARRPWTVHWRFYGGAFQAKVEANSLLYPPQGTVGPPAPVTGLDEWVTCTPSVSGGDAFWIEGLVTALGLTSSSIRSIGQGNTDYDVTGATGSWDPSGKGDLVNDGATPPNQTKFRVLLAKIAADANGNPVVTAVVSQNLIIVNKNVNGEPCIYAAPFGH